MYGFAAARATPKAAPSLHCIVAVSLLFIQF